MLKTLIAKLAKSLFRPKYNPGYQTRVYPRLGEMISAQVNVSYESLTSPVHFGDIYQAANAHLARLQVPGTQLTASTSIPRCSGASISTPPCCAYPA